MPIEQPDERLVTAIKIAETAELAAKAAGCDMAAYFHACAQRELRAVLTGEAEDDPVLPMPNLGST